MTARLIDIPGSELFPTVKKLSDAGFDADLAALVRKDGNAAKAVVAIRAALLREQPVSAVTTRASARLMHGLFNRPSVQVGIVRRLNREHGWGFTNAQFKALGNVPVWPKDRLVAVVLEICLLDQDKVTGIKRTFEELATLALDQHVNHWRWPELRSDADHLALLGGITHEPGLRWRTIDLGANWDKVSGIAPETVRNPKTSPHAALLSAALLHPAWVAAMDGVNVPFVWMAGYQATVPGYGSQASVPILDRGVDSGEVRLRADGCLGRGGGYAVPAFRE